MNTAELLIQLGGGLHFLILAASAMVPKYLKWERDLAGLPEFLRRLFWVYGAFIVLTIIGMGLVSFFCAREIALGTSLARAWAAFVAAFWAARLVVQLFVFDPRPYLTSRWLQIGYHLLTAAFIILTVIFGRAALA